MKLAKLVGLTAVLAIASVALIGASSVSATTLCLVSEEPCAAENVKENWLLLAAKSAANGFLGGVFTQECHVEVHVRSLNNITHDPATVDATWLVSSCSPCSGVAITSSNALAASGSGNGIIKGKLVFTYSGCPLGAECQFEGPEVALTALGSATNATVDANVKLKLIKGNAFLCGGEGTFHATFTSVNAEDKMTFVSLLASDPC